MRRIAWVRRGGRNSEKVLEAGNESSGRLIRSWTGVAHCSADGNPGASAGTEESTVECGHCAQDRGQRLESAVAMTFGSSRV